MFSWRPILITCSISVTTMILLSTTVSISSKNLPMSASDQTIPVFSSSIPLNSSGTEDQLLSFLIEHQMKLQLKSMDWNHQLVLLEIIQSKGMSEDEMYREIYKLVKSLLVQNDQINGVRLLVHQNHGPKFLLEINGVKAKELRSRSISSSSIKRYIEETSEIFPFPSSPSVD